MKVQIIGSGSMWTHFNSACFLIDNNIMVDIPNGSCKYLYINNTLPRSIEHILITHFHGDHYFDMPFLILNKSKNHCVDLNIYLSKEGKRKIQKIGKLAFPNSFKDACNNINIKYIYDNTFKINNYKVTKIPVDHGSMKPAYGYIFNSNNTNIGFTGDTSLCQNVEYMANNCTYLFCDCMLEIGNNKHQGIDNLEYLSSKYPSCNFVVVHLDDNTREKLINLKIKNIIIPNDYDIIKI